MKIKDQTLAYGSFKINNGRQPPFKDLYPTLYNIMQIVRMI